MSRLAGWWFAPAPPERLAALRIAIGAFAVIWMAARLPEVLAVARLPASALAPVGVIRVLGAPLPGPLAAAIAVATVAVLVAFTLGWRYRVTAPLAALGLLWTLSYRSSWGMVFHTDNLLVLHVIGLACAPAADAWAVDAVVLALRPRIGLARGADRRGVPAAGYGWAIKLLAAITCATYVLAGIAKLRLAGFAWIDGAQLRNQIAIDNVRKALLGGTVAPLARRLVGHPDGLGALAVLALGIELGAPLALLGGRIARLWAASAWVFHAGVVLAMNVWFPYPLAGVAFLPFSDAERLVRYARIDRLARWWRARGMRGAPHR